MTSIMVATPKEGQIRALNGRERWLMSSFAASAQHEEGTPTPDLTEGESGQLLDLDGLIEIERLIEEIKKDGRLKTGEKEGIERAGTPHRGRVKDQ